MTDKESDDGTTARRELPGSHATPLDDDERAQWDSVTQGLDAVAESVFHGSLDEAQMQEAFEEIRSFPLNRERILNAVHVPEDAGEFAGELEDLLRHIPDGWGRWISCERGWFPLITETHRRLVELDPDYEVHQVKQKFAGLRYYFEATEWATDDDAAEMRVIVKDAEKRSFSICEFCGAPAEQRETRSGWWVTVCPEHEDHD